MQAVSPSANFVELEKSILGYWEKNDCFKNSISRRKGSKPYLFYDGPPFATGLPHYGHMLAGTIKDIIPRYQTMRGHYVERRFGWDTHGLPIEMLTEKDLNLRGTGDIINFGIPKFNEECRSRVLTFVSQWRNVMTRLGRWVDFDNDYRTMDPEFMESVWWVFKQLWDRGRIYEGLRVMPYSWRLSTPLSNFEASSNYKLVQDPALTIKFKLVDQENTYLLAWTTTPWTLPSNLALCVSNKITYCKIKHENTCYILAKERLDSYFTKDMEYELISEFPGSSLVHLKYDPLLPYFTDLKSNGCFKILADDFVSTDDGTGIVHMSPAHGEDDFRICQAAGLPVVDPVDSEGNFTKDVPEVEGKNIKDADADIIKILKQSNKIFRHDTINHNYPFCERSDTPLIYKAITAWYVKVTDIREKMLKNNQEITWVPSHIKDGRFGNWLEQARDWNISRNRFWGNPLPVWRCNKCSETECFGSRAELEVKANCAVPDLHKHLVDELKWKCTKCDGTMQRIPEVLDCWFESGSMPYAQLHYPFENQETFNKGFPADFIAEGLDQTRGWFYTLMVLATSLFEKTPFKNCIVNGMILAEDGKKMSKRLKNYPDPSYVLDTYGADALRLYMINSPVVRGDSLRLSEAGVKEIVRSVLLPLWNVYSFFTTYAVVDKYQVSADITGSTNPIDRWIISRFQTLLSRVKEELDAYRLYTVVPALLEFIEELTNWYLRRSRRRFWSDDKNDKQAGYDTLYYILNGFSTALAPFLPFISETIYQNISKLDKSKTGSVHYLDYPIANEDLRNSDLENKVKLIQQAVSLGRTLRSRLDIRIRQALQSITVVTRSPADSLTLKEFEDDIKSELNVKEILFSDQEDEIIEYSVKAKFPVLGPRYGKQMGLVSKELGNLALNDILSLEAGNKITILNQEITISDVEIRRSPKSKTLEIETAQGVTVFFDTNLTQELIDEGLAREVINRIQRMRKEADLHISDRIIVQHKSDDKIKNAIINYAEYIKAETLCTDLSYHEAPTGFVQEHESDNLHFVIGITKL